MKLKKLIATMIIVLMMISIGGCGFTNMDTSINSTVNTKEEINSSIDLVIENITSGEVLSSEMFTERDMVQSYESLDAIYLELEDEKEVVIIEEGVYVISGEVENTTIIVEADEDTKIQIVLDGVYITNESEPAIYVKSAEKVFITTTDSKNYLGVLGEYSNTGMTNLDAVIFSKSDLIINGVGTLEIDALTGNGITSKDDIKITGGIIFINSLKDGIEANDSIRMNGGTVSIDSKKDALHSENEEDSMLGYIYIQNGALTIMAVDDAMRGTSFVQIDGGTITIESCEEGIEATYIQINGGTITINANDDGFNATTKSDSYEVLIEVNGGIINVTMASGDTDGFDSNGNIIINGGTINVVASSAFDANGIAELVAGDLTVNGEIMSEIIQTQMGGKNRK